MNNFPAASMSGRWEEAKALVPVQTFCSSGPIAICVTGFSGWPVTWVTAWPLINWAVLPTCRHMYWQSGLPDSTFCYVQQQASCASQHHQGSRGCSWNRWEQTAATRSLHGGIHVCVCRADACIWVSHSDSLYCQWSETTVHPILRQIPAYGELSACLALLTMKRACGD